MNLGVRHCYSTTKREQGPSLKQVLAGAARGAALSLLQSDAGNFAGPNLQLTLLWAWSYRQSRQERLAAKRTQRRRQREMPRRTREAASQSRGSSTNPGAAALSICWSSSLC